MPTRAARATRLLSNARVIIPAGFLLVLIAGIAVVIGLVRSREADHMVVHTLEVQQSAQNLLIDIRDAETSKRSFLLTNTPEYMEDFGVAMQQIPEELKPRRIEIGSGSITFGQDSAKQIEHDLPRKAA